MSKSYFHISGVEFTAAFHRGHVKSQFNLGQRLRLKCKRGSEKSLQRGALSLKPHCAHLVTQPTVPESVYYGILCVFYAVVPDLVTPLSITQDCFLLLRSVYCVWDKQGQEDEPAQPNKQTKKNRTWKECFTGLVGVHNRSSGWKNAFSGGNRK